MIKSKKIEIISTNSLSPDFDRGTKPTSAFAVAFSPPRVRVSAAELPQLYEAVLACGTTPHRLLAAGPLPLACLPLSALSQ